jgi:single-strand DNA-binding protein
MARTSKTADTGEENVIPLHPEGDEPAPTEDEALPAQTDEQPQPDDMPEAPPEQSRRSGPGLNRVELIGRLTKAPDLRASPGGTHVAYFRLATNGSAETEFHQCVAFGKTAEFLGEYVGQGRLVFIEGRLQTRTWDDRDGVRRWMTVIVVGRLQVLDSRRRAEQ